MYGINMETMHMISRIDVELKRKAMYNPNLKNSSMMRWERRDSRKYTKQLKKKILEEA